MCIIQAGLSTLACSKFTVFTAALFCNFASEEEDAPELNFGPCCLAS